MTEIRLRASVMLFKSGLSVSAMCVGETRSRSVVYSTWEEARLSVTCVALEERQGQW